MPKSLPQFTITFGGWYQRTTLHLSEIYDLFALSNSDLQLNPDKLKSLHQKLSFTSVTREWGELEYIRCLTTSGIEVRYYEDGLYILSLNTSHLISGQKQLTDYYENCLSPAISYIFSLGAPTPKILANIKSNHPFVISSSHKIELDKVYSHITSKLIDVAKTPSTIYIFTRPGFNHTEELIEMQIFFREFKDQLHRYLNLHREVWEQISEIKERGAIVGRDIESLRSDLDSYQKTISLIKSRLNQMGTYVRTRASISKKFELDEHLASIFQYKFETLNNTHAYIQDIWKMTQEYVDTAITVINEVKTQSTSNGINSLRLITTIGVLSGIFTYLSKDQFPKITLIGLWYFLVLILGTWLINQIVNIVYQNFRYRLKFTQHLGLK